MATFTQIKDVMVSCPYNPLHRVSSRRLQQHLIKCGRNPGNPELAECPFNAVHRVPKGELQQHILVCKDSRQVIREIEESRNRAPIIRPVVQQRDELPFSSNNDGWDDDDYDGPNYVIPGLVRPQTAEKEEDRFAIKSNIEIQCMKPSERKQYYKLLTEKSKSKQLPELKSEIRIKEEAVSSSTSSSSKPESSNKIKDVDIDHPNYVRKPTTMPFKNKVLGGIGRGNTPLGNRSDSLRSVGTVSSSVKRENESEDQYLNAKRFSPDLE